MHENMLCAVLLPTDTTAGELFKSWNDYTFGKLNWSLCVTMCMNRVAAVTRQLSGFIIIWVTSKCESTHCVMYSKMIASQKMSPELH